MNEHPWSNGKGDVPFDSNGNMQSFPSHTEVWKPNEVFEETLIFEGTGRGRSSALFYFRGETSGKRYSMFMKDAGEILSGLKLSGTWTYCKRGENYGVKRTAK